MYYFIYGAIEPIITAALSEHTPPESRGTLFGWIGTFQNLAGIFGPLLGSAISAAFSGYQSILAAISVMVAVVILLYRLCPKADCTIAAENICPRGVQTAARRTSSALSDSEGGETDRRFTIPGI